MWRFQEMVDLTNIIENLKGIFRGGGGEYTQFYEMLFIRKLENTQSKIGTENIKFKSDVGKTGSSWN